MRKSLVLCFLSIVLFCCSSDDDDDNQTSIDCDVDNSIAIISAELFENAPSDQLTINSLAIVNDDLTISFSASGCDGDSWELKLIDSEEVFESNPPQRELRLSLKNEELCQAFITRELTVDISNLQLADTNQIELNLTNSDDSILYEY